MEIHPPPYVIPPREGLASFRVYVACQSDEGRYAMGSGVAIASDRILTARHVVDVCQRHQQEILFISVLGADRYLRMAKVERGAADTEVDVVKLIVDPGFLSPAEIHNPIWPSSGTFCMVAGDHEELTFIRRCGQLAFWDAKYVTFDMEAIPGNSGGGVFDSENRLVAIVRAIAFFGSKKRLVAVPARKWTDLVEP